MQSNKVSKFDCRVDRFNIISVNFYVSLTKIWKKMALVDDSLV